VQQYEACHSCGGMVLEGAMYCSHCTTRHPLSAHPLNRVAKSLVTLAAPFAYVLLFGIRQLWRRRDHRRAPSVRLVNNHP
jgi:hypothetical protein